MNEFKAARNRILAERVIKGLQSRNMEGYFAETKEDALKIALDMIPEGSRIGWGGSRTLTDIGLKQAVCAGNYIVFNRDTCECETEKRQVERQIICESDYFLCSSNAITEDGILVNIDGNSNRVTAIAFGPKHVLIIAGMNKIVKSMEDAWRHARNDVAPVIGQIWPGDVPCKKVGICVDCKAKDTVCCQILTTRYSREDGRIRVILVNEELGL